MLILLNEENMVIYLWRNFLKESLAIKNYNAILNGFIYFLIWRISLYLDHIRFKLVKTFNKQEKLRVKVCNNYMYLNIKDKGLSKELLLYGKREYFSTNFLEEFIIDNEVMLDIGANIGYYVLLESQINKNGEIYAVEPVPSNISLLNNNIELNGIENVSSYQFAIGDKDGEETFYCYDKHNLCGFNKLDEKLTNEITVKKKSLDNFINSYIKKQPTFIRMDVEGYEYNILMNSTIIHNKNIPLKIFIELHSDLIGIKESFELIDDLRMANFKLIAMFIEPEGYICSSIKSINYLRGKLKLPEFGYVGNCYEKLYESLYKIDNISLFLERE